jgi:hypothetical protein
LFKPPTGVFRLSIFGVKFAKKIGMNTFKRFLILSVVSFLVLNCSSRNNESTSIFKPTTTSNGKAVLTYSGALPIDFGTISIGSNTTKTITITNTGTAAATSISFSSIDAPFTFQNISCLTGLAISASCTFNLTYTPTAVVSSNGTIHIQYSDVTSMLNNLPLTMVGMGAAAPVGHVKYLYPASSPVDYGFRQANSPIVSYQINFINDGTASLTFTGFPAHSGFFSYNGSAPIQNNTRCVVGTVLAVNSGCAVIVDLDPAHAPFPPSTVNPVQSSSLIAYSTNSTNFTIDLTVTAKIVTPQAPGAIVAKTYNPNAFKDVYANINPAPTGCITLTNEGGMPVTQITTPQALSAPFSFVTQATPACANPICTSINYLNPGATCDLAISYAPTAIGSHTTAAWVQYNPGDNTGMKTIQNIVNGNSIDSPVVAVTVTWTRIAIGDAGASYVKIRDINGVLYKLGGNSAYGGASTVTVTVNAKLTGCNVFGIQLLNSSNGIIRDTATTDMAREYYIKNNETTSAYLNDNNDAYYPDGNAKDNNFTLQVKYNGQAFKNYTIERNQQNLQCY